MNYVTIQDRYLAERWGQKTKLTVWRLERDADLRGGIFFGLNVFPKRGIFSDFLRSCEQDQEAWAP